MKNNNAIASEEEKEILKEMMNIAFGKATFHLAEIIDIYVKLSVPQVEILSANSLSDYIQKETKDYDTIDMVKQHFWGKFKGIAYLIFSAGAAKKLVTLLQNNSDERFENEPIAAMEKEALLEIGNIVIGACTGKLFELLKDVVTYSPPMAVIENTPKNAISVDEFDSNCSAIMLKALFHFEKEDINGSLFLVMSGSESIMRLKNALNEFVDQFE